MMHLWRLDILIIKVTMHCQGQGLYGKSIPSVHFHCEPGTFLQNVVYYIKDSSTSVKLLWVQ